MTIRELLKRIESRSYINAPRDPCAASNHRDAVAALHDLDNARRSNVSMSTHDAAEDYSGPFRLVSDPVDDNA